MSGTSGGPTFLTGKLPRVLQGAPALTLLVLASLAIGMGAIGLVAVTPYLFREATVQSEIARQVRAILGLDLSAGGPSRFALFPHPHVVVPTLQLTDSAGTLQIDAEALEGDVRLLPLIVGRVELASASLIKPRIAITLDDAGAISADSLIGRAMRAIAPHRTEAPQRLGTLTLIDGTAVLNGKNVKGASDVTSINLTVDWPDLDSPATLTGSLKVHDDLAEVAAWIAQPSALMRGDHSAVAFHVRATALDLSANGEFAATQTVGFQGHVTAKTPSAHGLLDLIGATDTTLLAPFENVAIDSDTRLTLDPDDRAAIDLQNLTLHADGNEYEGTLAFQGGARSSLSGTLASEQLSLVPFLAKVPPLLDAHRRWSRTPLFGKAPDLPDLDLRISATHLRAPPFTIDDAALSVITHARRTEVVLAAGKAYGGAAKARLSFGLTDAGVSLRGTATLTDADISALGWDTSGRQLATGMLSASASVDANGDSPAALAGSLQGTGNGHVADGELTGVDIGRAVRNAAPDKSDALFAALHSGRTPFNTLAFATQIFAGIATFQDSAIHGPDVTIDIEGGIDVGTRHLDIGATATPPAAPRKSAQRLKFDIGGSFDAPGVQTERP